MIYQEDIKTAVISKNGATDHELIAAPGTGKYLVIDFIAVVPAGGCNLTFKSATTALTGLFTLTTSQGFVLENSIHNPDGILKCASNEAFNVTASQAVLVGGFIKYRIKNG